MLDALLPLQLRGDAGSRGGSNCGRVFDLVFGRSLDALNGATLAGGGSSIGVLADRAARASVESRLARRLLAGGLVEARALSWFLSHGAVRRALAMIKRDE